MNNAPRPGWLRITLLVGAIYCGANIGLAELAARATSHPLVLAWRWGAFAVSGVVFLMHVAHEHNRLHSGMWRGAWHVALAAALGGFGLAFTANIHDLGAAAGYRPRMAIALAVWPLLTAVPAFLFALLLAAGLAARQARRTVR
jgi:hypothetical protein